MTTPVEPPVVTPVDPPKVITPPVVEAPKVEAPPPVPQNQAPDMAAFLKNLVDSIGAMPEKIVDAIKESAPSKPADTAVTPPVVTDTTSVPPGEKPKGKSFAHRWFGV